MATDTNATTVPPAPSEPAPFPRLAVDPAEPAPPPPPDPQKADAPDPSKFTDYRTFIQHPYFKLPSDAPVERINEKLADLLRGIPLEQWPPEHQLAVVRRHHRWREGLMTSRIQELYAQYHATRELATLWPDIEWIRQQICQAARYKNARAVRFLRDVTGCANVAMACRALQHVEPRHLLRSVCEAMLGIG